MRKTITFLWMVLFCLSCLVILNSAQAQYDEDMIPSVWIKSAWLVCLGNDGSLREPPNCQSGDKPILYFTLGGEVDSVSEKVMVFASINSNGIVVTSANPRTTRIPHIVYEDGSIQILDWLTRKIPLRPIWTLGGQELTLTIRVVRATTGGFLDEWTVPIFLISPKG